MGQTKVVILGGGFAGIAVAESLGRTKFDVWLIDKTNHHLFPPFLYEVATAALSAADIAIPFRELLSSHKNINVLMGEVVSIDKQERTVQLRSGERIGYDFLVIALGSHLSYFGHDSWAEFALGLKSLSDALKLRERILISFEKAESCSSISEAEEYLNFIIIGGGPTGVEMAGAIAEMCCDKTMLRNFRRIDPKNAKIFLVEAMPRILSSFPENLSRKAQGYLEGFGVQVMTNRRVSEISAKGIKIEQTFIPARTVIWAAGDRGSPILKTLGVPLDRQERAIVDAGLSIPNHPEIFVIGDAASALDKMKNPLPGVAPVAVQQGRYVGRILRSNLPQKLRAPFSYFDKGSLAAVGKTKAIGTFRKWQFSGFFAWMIWGFVHVIYLKGLRNRLSVTMQWVFSFFIRQKGARLIYRSIDKES